MNANRQITIDGSLGEGGGQILRSTLALAILTQQPVRIKNIRAKRAKPGLRQQHLTSVRAGAEICDGELTGDEIGSRELTFNPNAVRSGAYRFDIRTAGSTTLVLQTVFPPLMLANGTSTVTLIGGTHNPMAPPVDFLEHAFLPIIRRMGPQVTLSLERYGFYPVGGGCVTARIESVERLRSIEFTERGEIVQGTAEAIVAGLPINIAERELQVVASKLDWPAEQLRTRDFPTGCGQANVLMLTLRCEHATEVATGFGEKGVKAEHVAGRAVKALQEYIAANVPVGEHLADQLLLPFALAGGGSFVSMPLSLHAQTNMNIIRTFLPVDFQVASLDKNRVQVTVVTT